MNKFFFRIANKSWLKFALVAITTFHICLFALAANAANDDISELADQTDRLRAELEALKDELYTLKQQQSTTGSQQGGEDIKPILHSDGSFHLEEYPLEVARTLTYIGGMPIISAPYSGVRTPYDGAHLITNFPKTRLELNVLQQRQGIERFLVENDMHVTNRPFVEISGDVEIVGVIQDRSGSATTAAIDYSELEIVITTGINRWVSGLISILLDTRPPQSTTTSAPASLVDNSNLFMEVGFLTIGNLNENPFFVTVGQTYVPFGRFTNYFINVMPPRALSRTKARNIAIGYRQPGDNSIYATVFGFESDTRSPGPNGIIGGTLAYAFSEETMSGEVGAGIISNVADSVGMQRFAGFGTSAVTERIAHGVPAINAYARLNVGDFGFLAEYVGTTRAFAPQDLSFNNRGAQPQTWDGQAAYFFDFYNKPAAIAVGYAGSTEALALAIPRHRIAAAFSISIWRNTIQAIEFRRDITYSAGTQASGPVITIDGTATDTSQARFARSTSAVTLLMAGYY